MRRGLGGRSEKIGAVSGGSLSRYRSVGLQYQFLDPASQRVETAYADEMQMPQYCKVEIEIGIMDCYWYFSTKVLDE